MAAVAALLFGCSLWLPQAPASVDPAGIAGTLLICGGGKQPAAVYDRFVELAGGADARIVLVPTAGGADFDASERRARYLADWPEGRRGSYEVLHTRDRAVADSEAFTAPLRKATAVWFSGGQQSRLAEAYLGTRFEREVMALLQRGGVVGGTSAGAAILSRHMIAEGNPVPRMATGFDAVTAAVVDQHFLARDRLPRLRAALAAAPGCFGLGIDEGTAVLIHGRQLRVLGNSKVVLLLGAGAGRPERSEQLAAGEIADLVTWQRAAGQRAGAPWPPKPMATPDVPHGALVVIGGGGIPPAAADRFVALAGGKAAKVVLVPTASGADPQGDAAFAALLRQRGVTDIRVFHCEHPSQVTEARLAVLADATAVWFGGGRQWRLCDAYDGTKAVAAFQAVLQRGGVIGGSSAGATIQGEFLVRGNPLGNTEEWCEGYERGFGFLPGCAIDQHFFARHRQGDLRELVRQLPQLLGIGIDEGTAIVVQGQVAEVIGASTVAFYGNGTEAVLQAGERFDLAKIEKL